MAMTAEPSDNDSVIRELTEQVATLRAELRAEPDSVARHLDLVHALTLLADAAADADDPAAQADEPIELLRAAAELTGEDEQPEVLTELAGLLSWRALARAEESDGPSATQRIVDRDEAIDRLDVVWRIADDLGLRAEFVAEQFPTVQRVTDLLLARANETGSRQDASTAVDYAQAVLAALPEPDIDQAISHYQLTQAHLLLSAEWDGAAIPHLRALADMSVEHPWRDESAVLLGLRLAQRTLRESESESTNDVAEAIQRLSRAEELLADDTTGARTLIRFWHSAALAMRFAQGAGDEHDLAAAIAGFTEVRDTADTPQTPALPDYSRIFLAWLHMLRGAPAEMLPLSPGRLDYDTMMQLAKRHAGKPGTGLISAEDAEEITRQLDGMSEAALADPATGAMARDLKAVAVLLQGVDGRSDEELDRTIDLLTGLAQFPDEESGLLPGVLRELFSVYLADRRGTPSSVTQSVDRLLDTAGRTDVGHPMRRLVEDALGASVTIDTGPRDSTDAVNELADQLERVLAELPDDHPARTRALTGLARSVLAITAEVKQIEQLDRLRVLLRREVERERGSTVDTGLGYLMLGMVENAQGMLAEDAELIRTALDHNQRAIALLPADHPMIGNLPLLVSMSLAARSAVGGGLEDLDAAAYYVAPARRMSHQTAASRAIRPEFGQALHRMMKAQAAVQRNPDLPSVEQLDEMLEATELARSLPELPRGASRMVATSVERIRALRNMIGDDGQLRMPKAGPQLDDLLATAGHLLASVTDSPAGPRADPTDTLSAAFTAVTTGLAARDVRTIDRGISLIGPLCADPGLTPKRRLRSLLALGTALRIRHELTRDARDISNAVDRFEEARRLVEQQAGQGTFLVDGAFVLVQLGSCYAARRDSARRDQHRAVTTGLAGLRGRAEHVLMQTSAERSLATALSATDEAAEVARWCVEFGEPEAAVRALEIGRGMVLHVATAERGLPALLRAGGHPELADRWAHEAEQADAPWDLATPDPSADGLDLTEGVSLPSELRREVLAAIDGTDISARLFAPPSIEEIAAALRAAGAEALAYLLPGDGDPGLVVLVDAAGTVRSHRLPRLRLGSGDPIDAFLAAQRNKLAEEQRQPADKERRLELDRHWVTALDRLCEWAWTAAMGPVLEQVLGLRPGRPHRVVLVPVGKLGAVPWHAACRPVFGGVRYAAQDAILSYAASARQLVDATRRGRPDLLAAPALIRVADSGLYWDAKELAEVRAHCYPNCTSLGMDDEHGRPVLPSDVFALLPGEDGDGASVLHIGCHGRYEPVPVDSSLELDNDSRLYVRDILRRARDRPADAPGGLVVLATCVSDLTARGHDEALTVASAFLAAGGVGVVGTRWPVHDLPTALFMIMFHHYLNFGYPDPATALRAAQSWMLNPGRVLPDGIDPGLAGPMRRADLATVRNWAAFTYQGR